MHISNRLLICAIFSNFSIMSLNNFCLLCIYPLFQILRKCFNFITNIFVEFAFSLAHMCFSLLCQIHFHKEILLLIKMQLVCIQKYIVYSCSTRTFVVKKYVNLFIAQNFDDLVLKLITIDVRLKRPNIKNILT